MQTPHYRALLRKAVTAICTLTLTNPCPSSALGQGLDGTTTLDLGIIVVPTMPEAEKVLAQLKIGADFAVLAKEKSTDATATDGGYMGRVNPAELRPELRDALKGHGAEGFTGVVHLPSGTPS